MIISLIAAIAKNGVIGMNGTIPWNSKEDMAFFKNKTLNHPVIMGRKTYDSLRVKPLPNRFNVVITSNKELWNHDQEVKDFGPLYVPSLTEAVNAVDDMANEIFIIGGSQVYNDALTLDIVDRMYLNFMNTPEEPQGDAYFPYFDNKVWSLTESDKKYNDFTSYVAIRMRHPEDATAI